MPNTLPKSDVLKAVNELPHDNLSLDEIMDKLIVIHKVRTALAEQEPSIPHQTVVEQFKKPRQERTW